MVLIMKCQYQCYHIYFDALYLKQMGVALFKLRMVSTVLCKKQSSGCRHLNHSYLYPKREN